MNDWLKTENKDDEDSQLITERKLLPNKIIDQDKVIKAYMRANEKEYEVLQGLGDIV